MTKEMTIAEKIALAKASKNQAEAKAGGDYEREVPPAGVCYSRFIEYIECGKHPASYEGKPKAPAARTRLLFELLTAVPKRDASGAVVKGEDGKPIMIPNIKEVEVEGGKKKFANQISIELTESQSDKSGFYKLFKAMQYGRENITHFAEMLGEAFKVEVVHSVPKTDKDPVYANVFTKERGWLVQSPFMEKTDPETLEVERVDMSSKVPQAISPIRLFLWDYPDNGSWDALFIDGTKTVKDKDGKDSEVSKNWLQEKIMSAVNYGGSPLEQMLGKVDNLPGMAETEAGVVVDTVTTGTTETAATTKTVASVPAEQASASTGATTVAVSDSDAALREMGLL